MSRHVTAFRRETQHLRHGLRNRRAPQCYFCFRHKPSRQRYGEAPAGRGRERARTSRTTSNKPPKQVACSFPKIPNLLAACVVKRRPLIESSSHAPPSLPHILCTPPRRFWVRLGDPIGQTQAPFIHGIDCHVHPAPDRLASNLYPVSPGLRVLHQGRKLQGSRAEVAVRGRVPDSRAGSYTFARSTL